MPSFSGCRVTVEYDDGRPAHEDDDSDLQLGEGRLLLSYWDEQGVVVWVGSESEPGRYDLSARSRPRQGTLRREGPRSFAGSWREGEASGRLRVEIRGASPERAR